jgi:hypothetical protein
MEGSPFRDDQEAVRPPPSLSKDVIRMGVAKASYGNYVTVLRSCVLPLKIIDAARRGDIISAKETKDEGCRRTKVIEFFFFFFWADSPRRAGEKRNNTTTCLFTRPGWRSAEIYARSAKTRERRSAVAGAREWTLEWGEGAELDAH